MSIEEFNTFWDECYRGYKSPKGDWELLKQETSKEVIKFLDEIVETQNLAELLPLE